MIQRCNHFIPIFKNGMNWFTKHCQRHNGPRVLILELELSLLLKIIQIELKEKRSLRLALQVWPPGSQTCNATLPMIALLTSSVGIESLSSSARVISVKSAQGVVASLRDQDP